MKSTILHNLMMCKKMIWILAVLKQITLEPLTFLDSLSYHVDKGAQVTSDLIIWKMCHIELNFTEEECGNLTCSGFEVNHCRYPYSIIKT